MLDLKTYRGGVYMKMKGISGENFMIQDKDTSEDTVQKHRTRAWGLGYSEIRGQGPKLRCGPGGTGLRGHIHRVRLWTTA